MGNIDALAQGFDNRSDDAFIVNSYFDNLSMTLVNYISY